MSLQRERMEEGNDPLRVQHEPEIIIPDQEEEEEEGDISQESDSDDDDSENDDDKGNEKKKARVRRETNSETSDSDSGVEDPTPASKEALYQMLAQAVEKRKKEARMRKEEAWISNDGEVAVGKGKDQSYKELPKVKNSCGIRDFYEIPELSVVGPKLHKICEHILNTNIMISPLNQEFTQNSYGDHSLVMGEWKSQLEERYKMKTGFWREEEDQLLRSRCDELLEKGLCEDGDELADLINSQTGSEKERKPKKKSRDPSARNIVGLYLGMDLPHRTAFECSQRFVQLVKGVSVLNKKDKELALARAKEIKTKKVKTMFTQEEDKLLVELVLRKKSGNFKTVDETDQRVKGSTAELRIPWVTMSKEFVDRKWTRLRDRWQVYLKPVLERPDLWERTEDVVGLDCDLLLAVANTGAKNLKTVPWDKVMEAVPGHLPAFLKSRLRGLTRQHIDKDNDLHEKVGQILHNIQNGKTLATGSSKRSGQRDRIVERTRERNAELIEYYQYLLSRNKKDCDAN